MSWSAGMYQRVSIPAAQTKPISDLLEQYDKGSDPGSLYYLPQSTHYLIRTKALQEHSTLIYPKGDAITPLNPRAFTDLHLTDGDILLSKDSNVGECAMVDGHRWHNHTLSGGIVRLRPNIDRFYMLAFLKHPIFKAQLHAIVPRGATIAHANKLWLNCLMPFPTGSDATRTTKYVSALMQAIFEKEQAIRSRSDSILEAITTELTSRQRNREFRYAYPTISNVKSLLRFDAAIYSTELKSKLWLIQNYASGFKTPGTAGFTVTPGPSLEIKILRTRIDSDTFHPGYYALLIPSNISNYGTMNTVSFIGTPKKLPLLRQGDILFGEAGFQKGRSIVLAEGYDHATTNAHGLYARRADGDLNSSIYFRCIFHWYRNMRLIDLMAAGGSGGHFSPSYFESLLIPNFPDDVRRKIIELYHKATAPPPKPLTIGNFVEWHREWNDRLGIWELDRELKALQLKLLAVQDKIIDGKPIKPHSLNPDLTNTERA